MNVTNSVGRAMWLLGPLTVALLCGGLLTGVQLLTADRIESNEREQSRQALLQLLEGIVDADSLVAADWSPTTETLCLQRLLVLRRSSAGYAGAIHMLLAITPAEPPELTALAVTSHLETPGIADFLGDAAGTGWLTTLRGRTAGELQQVDTVSGATISSRAVLNAAATALLEASADGCNGGPAP